MRHFNACQPAAHKIGVAMPSLKKPIESAVVAVMLYMAFVVTPTVPHKTAAPITNNNPERVSEPPVVDVFTKSLLVLESQL
jgi:hypothetical protein